MKMRANFPPTEAQIKRVHKLKAGGFRVKEIATVTGLTSYQVNGIVDPTFLARKHTADKRSREKSKIYKSSLGDCRSAFEFREDLERRFAERAAQSINDNRNLTGRLMGDPLPSRSAIAQREHHGR
jgi:viroplasmin and RNaseH domain-containing protein